MYLGLLLLLTAWAIWLSNPVALIFLPVFMLYMTLFQIRPEEKALLDKFGSEYLAYMRSVRRWL
jgi:protein-S-isoprenylcysteine O-methyltransferase Ste14